MQKFYPYILNIPRTTYNVRRLCTITPQMERSTAQPPEHSNLKWNRMWNGMDSYIPPHAEFELMSEPLMFSDHVLKYKPFTLTKRDAPM